MTARADRVDVEPLKQAFIESGLTASEVAYRLGWCRASGLGDESRVLRKLGLREYTSQKRKYRTEHISRTNAVLICRALHLDPIDVGL